MRKRRDIVAPSIPSLSFYAPFEALRRAYGRLGRTSSKEAAMKDANAAFRAMIDHVRPHANAIGLLLTNPPTAEEIMNNPRRRQLLDAEIRIASGLGIDEAEIRSALDRSSLAKLLPSRVPVRFDQLELQLEEIHSAVIRVFESGLPFDRSKNASVRGAAVQAGKNIAAGVGLLAANAGYARELSILSCLLGGGRIYGARRITTKGEYHP